MGALKLTWTVVSWAIPIFMLMGAVYLVQSQPLASPLEIKSSMRWLVALVAPLAFYFFWQIKLSGTRSIFTQCLTTLGPSPSLIYAFCCTLQPSLVGGKDGQGEIAISALYDTFLNGLLFNFFANFQITFSGFQPDSHLRVWHVYNICLQRALHVHFASRHIRNAKVIETTSRDRWGLTTDFSAVDLTKTLHSSRQFCPE